MTEPGAAAQRSPALDAAQLRHHTAYRQHIGDGARPLLAARITENVRRYATHETLLGSVDPTLGY